MMQFSTSMPKALIIRAGTTIMITPYQLQQEGPSVAPTIIARDADPEGFFDQYKKYIDRLLELSTPFEKLNKNKLTKDFLHSHMEIIYQKNFTKICGLVIHWIFWD